MTVFTPAIMYMILPQEAHPSTKLFSCKDERLALRRCRHDRPRHTEFYEHRYERRALERISACPT